MKRLAKYKADYKRELVEFIFKIEFVKIKVMN